MKTTTKSSNTFWVLDMDWEITELLLELIKEQFIVEHNKPKDKQDETRLKMLRKMAVGIHDQRIFLNMKRQKELKNAKTC